MLKPVSIAVAGVIALIAIPVSCEYIENPRNYFEKYTPELHKGMWVPDIFPKDIREIYEQHDVDTNMVWLKFKKGSKSLDISKYTKLDRHEYEMVRPFWAFWWFDELSDEYELYLGNCGKSRSAKLAMSPTHEEVYWWCD